MRRDKRPLGIFNGPKDSDDSSSDGVSDNLEHHNHDTLEADDTPLRSWASKDDDKDKDGDKPYRPHRGGQWGVIFFMLFLAAMCFILFLFIGVKRLPEAQYQIARDKVCENILNKDCDFRPPDDARIFRREVNTGEPVLTELNVLSTWTERTPAFYVLENKFESLNINYSVLNDTFLNSGNTLIGIFEENRSRSAGNHARIEAGVHYLLAGSNGDYDARELYDDLNLSLAQENEARRAFADLLVMNGAEGYFRLGQLYLGNPAQESGNEGYPSESPPRFLDHAFRTPRFLNNFLTTTPQFDNAYEAMHKAVMCNQTNALQWREYIAELAGYNRAQEDRLKNNARQELDRLAQETIGGIEDHCEAKTFHQRINQLTDEAVVYRFVVDRRAWPSIQELVFKLKLSEAEFDRWIGVLIREAYDVYGFNRDYRQAPYGGPGNGFGSQRPSAPGSQYYRSGPGGAVLDPTAPGAGSRDAYLSCVDDAAAALAAGDAYLRIGETRQAQQYYQQALTLGRECAAPATEKAQKRLAALNLACEYNSTSIARISRDVESSDGSVIKLAARQRALRAHGYYDGAIDGRYGTGTRRAVEKFQDDFGFEKTGDLTPIETVYLICSAATVKADTASKTTLGVMYLTGLGTVQNIDAGLRFLKQAADENDADALFNLATVYGLGTVTSSYQLCGIPQNYARADSYLEQAAAYGHPVANRLIDKYQNDSPSDRWQKYENDLKDEFFKNQLINTPEGCTPNP